MLELGIGLGLLLLTVAVSDLGSGDHKVNIYRREYQHITTSVIVWLVTVWISSATRDLLLIQQNKFYWLSNRSGVKSSLSRLLPFDLFTENSEHLSLVSVNIHGN